MEDETIDPRIKDELECLNSTSEKINQLENDLNKKRHQYRSTLVESTQQLNQLSRKLGDCVAKARPYYEARRIAKEALQETQQAALSFERAVSMHNAAREMVSVAEQGMFKDCNTRDSAWPEMLNHATIKVNEAEVERYSSETEHKKKADAFKQAEKTVKKFEKKLKSSIQKSRPYFETKQHTQKALEDISEAVKQQEADLQKAKTLYSNTLHNLEEISDSIHETRDTISQHQQIMMLGERGDGVGAESVPTIEINECSSESGFGDDISIRTVLSDLRKVDSIDHLDGILKSTSLDTLSCNSGGSLTSSNSGIVMKERSASPAVMLNISSKSIENKETNMKNEERDLKQPNQSQENLVDNTSETQSTSSKTLNGLLQKYKSSSNNSKMTSTKSTSVISPTSHKAYSGEVLLTIAGLGEVSTS
ncbi:unnamed protein product [Clavelina lepadiformis]|uniref:SH3 domain-binding protein 5-like protein n=1 Tax=Clavelina lepadiformis TaxID=159417 RepID=A0ABP0F4P4_CLALP